MSNPTTFETEKPDDVESMMAEAVTVAEADVVKLIAPATLVSGATFEATVDGINFMATVPEGGVIEGEPFEVPYPSRSTLSRQVQAPRWKVDLFDCCHGGFGMCLLAFFCPMILFTQVMERLNLTLGGCLPRVGSGQRRSGIVNTLGIFFTFVLLIMTPYIGLMVSISEKFIPGILVFYFLLYAVFIFYLVAMICTRNSFRKTYNLPPICCSTGGNDCCDDCCITYFCGPCSALQMANHSFDPSIHSFLLCSRTGIRMHSELPARDRNMQIV